MEPDSPAVPQDFCIHHWVEEMVLRTKLIKFIDRYQSILWFSEAVGSQVAFKGERGSTGYAGHWREEFGEINIFNHLQPSRGLMHLEVNVWVLKVPVVENGTLPKKTTRLLPCVKGLHLSLINSFMQWLKKPGIEFLILSLRNKMPDTMNTWHHIMHSQWQMKGLSSAQDLWCEKLLPIIR